MAIARCLCKSTHSAHPSFQRIKRFGRNLIITDILQHVRQASALLTLFPQLLLAILGAFGAPCCAGFGWRYEYLIPGCRRFNLISRVAVNKPSFFDEGFAIGRGKRRPPPAFQAAHLASLAQFALAVIINTFQSRCWWCFGVGLAGTWALADNAKARGETAPVLDIAKIDDQDQTGVTGRQPDHRL